MPGRLKIGSRFMKIGSRYLRIGPIGASAVVNHDWLSAGDSGASDPEDVPTSDAVAGDLLIIFFALAGDDLSGTLPTFQYHSMSLVTKETVGPNGLYIYQGIHDGVHSTLGDFVPPLPVSHAGSDYNLVRVRAGDFNAASPIVASDIFGPYTGTSHVLTIGPMAEADNLIIVYDSGGSAAPIAVSPSDYDQVRNSAVFGRGWDFHDESLTQIEFTYSLSASRRYWAVEVDATP